MTATQDSSSMAMGVYWPRYLELQSYSYEPGCSLVPSRVKMKRKKQRSNGCGLLLLLTFDSLGSTLLLWYSRAAVQSATEL